MLDILLLPYEKYEPRHDKTNKMSVRPAKIQINLGIHPVVSESSLYAQWVAKDPGFLHADSEDSDQTGRMLRLKPGGQSWSNFMCSIIGVGERLHKVLGQIGSLRWAIVAFWASCLSSLPLHGAHGLSFIQVFFLHYLDWPGGFSSLPSDWQGVFS